MRRLFSVVPSLILLALGMSNASTVYASSNPSNQGCLVTGQTPPDASDESWFTLRNGCSEPVVAFYCLVSNEPVGSDPAEIQKDCRLDAGERIVSFGEGLIYLYAPTSVAQFQRLSNENRLTISPGETWRSNELATGRDDYRARLFVASCILSNYLSGKCRPNSVEYWRSLGGPTP